MQYRERDVSKEPVQIYEVRIRKQRCFNGNAEEKTSNKNGKIIQSENKKRKFINKNTV